ncbi:MAG: hypothetical protein KC503_08890 [Myxococcales bacterium]|nr:hypothetical protein [Myxococcales bacterium]
MRHTLACLAACCACGCAAADLRPVREELAIVRDAVREQSAETARLHAEVRRALAHAATPAAPRSMQQFRGWIYRPARGCYLVHPRALAYLSEHISLLDRAATLTVAGGGVTIKNLVDGSVLHAAGLRDGDVVAKVDGVTASSASALPAALARLARDAKATARLAIKRGARDLSLCYRVAPASALAGPRKDAGATAR